MAIVIDLAVSDKKTDAALSRLEKALERLEKVQQKLKDTLDQTAASANAVAGAYGKMATNAGRAASATSRVKPPPVIDAAKAKAYAAARLAADPTDKAALAMYNQATRKLNGQDPNKQLMTAIMRTRFAHTATGKLIGMPLGVDLMKFGPDLMGAGIGGSAAGDAGAASATMARVTALLAKLGPYMVPVILGLAKLAVQLRLAALGAAGLAAAGRVQARIGGYAGQGLNLGPAATVAGGDAASLAMQLQAGIEGGIGTGYAVQAGINPLGGPFGDMDYAAKLQKALKFIAGSASMDEARRRAAGMGIPDAANVFNLSPKNKAKIGQGQALSQQDLTRAADFEFNLGRIGAAFEKIKLRFLAPLVEWGANILEMLAATLEKMDTFFKWLFEKIDRLMGRDPKKESAQEKNTKALDQNTRAMNNMTREIEGGGPRAKGAVPSRVNGMQPRAMNEIRQGAI